MEDDLKAKIQKNLQIEKQRRAEELQEMEKLNAAQKAKEDKDKKAGNAVFQVLNKFKKD